MGYLTGMITLSSRNKSTAGGWVVGISILCLYLFASAWAHIFMGEFFFGIFLYAVLALQMLVLDSYWKDVLRSVNQDQRLMLMNRWGKIEMFYLQGPDGIHVVVPEGRVEKARREMNGVIGFGRVYEGTCRYIN